MSRSRENLLACAAPWGVGPLHALLLGAMFVAQGCSTFRGPPILSKLDPGGTVKSQKQSMSNGLKTLVGKGPNKRVADELYQQAQAAFQEAKTASPETRAGKYLRAGGLFVKAAERWPNSDLHENALFYSGECYFFADHYDDATDQFGALVKAYPHSRHIDQVQARRFAIARYWEELVRKKPESAFTLNLTNEERPVRDTRGHALRMYDNIRIDDPTGKLADDATLAAGIAQLERRNFVAADQFFTDLRETFPDSEHQFMGHFLGIQAKLASYQGTDYSGEMLDEAEVLIERTRTAFPEESQQEAEYLSRAYARVRMLKAEREWADGGYYDRRKEYGAARFHYQRLIAEYPGTPLAQDAEQRLAQIGGLPDVPPEKLQWLVNLFPNAEEEAPLLAGQASAGAPTGR